MGKILPIIEARRAKAHKWRPLAIVFWGVMVVLWGAAFFRHPNPFAGIIAALVLWPFVVLVKRQLRDAPTPSVPASATAPDVPNANAGEPRMALSDTEARASSSSEASERGASAKKGSIISRGLRSLLEAVFGGAFIYLIAFAALSTASPGSDGRAATLWSLLVVAVVLGVAVVVVGFRKRQPIVRAAGFSLLVAGGLFGNVIDTDFRRQASLDELEAKLPSAESMELKDRYQLFMELVELVPKNPDYRAQRDQLKLALKEQEREQAAEKERVRIAAEEEQRKKAREEACAKMSRSPDASVEAMQQWLAGAGKPGYKTPPPNFISNFVREQLTCYPGDEKLTKFLARLEAGARKTALEEDVFRNPQSYLNLKIVRWTKSAGGALAEVDFRIQSAAPEPEIVMRDITIACNWTAPSGTIVSTKQHTIYDVVKGGATRSFKEVNLGFIDPQASRMSCSVISAKPGWLYD